MRQRWLRSLALSLGFLVLGQSAFLKAEPPAPRFEPYPPVETPRPKAEAAAESDSSAPVASLARPIPLNDDRPVVDRKIQPTGLFSNNSENNTFAFSPAGGLPVARPMPAGPASNSVPLPMPTAVPTTPQQPDVPYTWRQPAASAPTSQNVMSAPMLSMPSAQPGTTFGTATPLSPGTSFGMDAPMPGAVVSPGIVPTPGAVPPPGIVGAPGVATGPMGAPLVDGGCMGGDCCAPGCCQPNCGAQDCCMPGCCAPGCGDCACCDACCGWGNGCCFGNRWYASAEYLLWFIRGQSQPPLLTSGSLADAVPGAIGQAGTSVLYGNSIYNNNPYSGTRLRFGYWFNDNHSLGIDMGGFWLGGKSNSFTASSLGSTVLARPFVTAVDLPALGVAAGSPASEPLAGPGLAGTFNAINTFSLFGAEANLRRNFLCGCNWFIDGFAGWRLLGLNESLSLHENLAYLAPFPSAALPITPAGATIGVNDRFATSNLFNGAQIGAIGEYRFGRFCIDLRLASALGGTQQNVNINGSTAFAGPGISPTTVPGGVLAVSSNMGGHTRTMVSLVEEVGFNIGYQFTNHIRAFVGYNFLYWTSVVRPAQQIDLTVNPNLIPSAPNSPLPLASTPGGPNRPAFSFNGNNFWAQGIQFGIDIRW